MIDLSYCLIAGGLAVLAILLIFALCDYLEDTEAADETQDDFTPSMRRWEHVLLRRNSEED